MSRWIKILLALVVVFLLLQLIPVRTDPPAEIPVDDFLAYANTPEDIAVLVRTSCYPCHSYNTAEPGFTQRIFPFSYFHQQRMAGAREALNYAEWTNYRVGTQFHKMEATVNVLERGHAPFDRYARSHPEAAWSNDQKAILLNYFSSWKEALR